MPSGNTSTHFVLQPIPLHQEPPMPPPPPDPISNASEIRQLVTPYLAGLSSIRATIVGHSLDAIHTVCRNIAQCQAGKMTADEADYITAWHAVQQAASSLRYAIRHRLDEDDISRLAAAVNRTTLFLRAPTSG